MSLSVDTPFEWDIGTAYDFFISLSVLHDPDKFGLRGSWAAGVRSRLPAAEREMLQRAIAFIWPIHWVYELPAPKDSHTALGVLESLSPIDRLFALISPVSAETQEVWRGIANRRSWTEDDLNYMTTLMQEEGLKKVSPHTLRKKVGDFLDLWREADATGEGLLSALNCYYDVFFAEEEMRIRPALEQAHTRAQELAQGLGLPQLLEELSQGVRLEKDWGFTEYVLAPSFWGTPLLIFGHITEKKGIILYGGRPSDASLIPGDVVPDVLNQALKALADPTRLRILRYLNEEPRTPAELARLLRLRAPTVIHHLDALRLARLVVITLEAEGKRYTIRPGAVEKTLVMMNEFLMGSND